jgi:hypothetical protein
VTSVEVTRSGRVVCRAAVELPVSATVAWGQLRDFRLFAAQDFFHAAVRVDAGGVRRGAALEIDHRFGPFAVTRVGRILQWEENVGYSFSDLSRRGPRSGFPHVYRYRLSPAGDARCVVEVSIAGLWTLQGVPKWVVRLWLKWVFSHIVRSAHNTLLEQCDIAGSVSSRGLPRDLGKQSGAAPLAGIPRRQASCSENVRPRVV